MKLTIPIILLTIFGLPMLAFNLYAIGSWEKFSGALEGVDPIIPLQF